MDNVNVKPKNDDLYIKGQFLGLEVHFSSFTVVSQLYMGKEVAVSYQVLRYTFPICFLSKFFRLNGTIASKYHCHRPDYVEDVVTVVGGKGVSL